MSSNLKIKKQKNIIIISLIIIIGLFVSLAIIKHNHNYQKLNPSDMILFYGDTCPHCQAVAKYIKDNHVKNNLKFKELEVYHNQHNSALLTQYAERCGLDTSEGIGIPLFWTGQKCLVGENEVISFFREH